MTAHAIYSVLLLMGVTELWRVQLSLVLRAQYSRAELLTLMGNQNVQDQVVVEQLWTLLIKQIVRICTAVPL